MWRKAVSEKCRKKPEPETLTSGGLGLAATFFAGNES